MPKNVWTEDENVNMMQLEDKEFNLCDFALFMSVMKNEKAHESVLSIITGEADLKLKEVHVEEVVLNKSGQRAIRLDARSTDTSGRNFATEMQNDRSIYELLEEKGSVSENTQKMLLKETDKERLKLWLKKAARSDSEADFLKKIQEE